MSTKLEMTLRSGVTISVDVETFTLKKTLGGDKSLEWTTPDKAKRRLVTFELNQIDAIVEVTT